MWCNHDIEPVTYLSSWLRAQLIIRAEQLEPFSQPSWARACDFNQWNAARSNQLSTHQGLVLHLDFREGITVRHCESRGYSQNREQYTANIGLEQGTVHKTDEERKQRFCNFERTGKREGLVPAG